MKIISMYCLHFAVDTQATHFQTFWQFFFCKKNFTCERKKIIIYFLVHKKVYKIRKLVFYIILFNVHVCKSENVRPRSFNFVGTVNGFGKILLLPTASVPVLEESVCHYASRFTTHFSDG